MSQSDLQTAPWEADERQCLDTDLPGAPAQPTEFTSAAEGMVDDSSPTELVADSFAFGVAFMFGLNIIQKLVGLTRNVLVCRLLEPAELGRWNLAFSFLLLMAPLAVLGLPGVFGRYVEYYRHRGTLRSFLRRILLTTVAASVIAIGLISLAPTTIAQLVFNDPSQASLIRMAVGVLALVIGFNFLTELLTALRQVRLVSIMQFSHSFVFACGAIGLLLFTSWGTEAIVSAYALGCVAAMAVSIPLVWRIWRKLPLETDSPSARSMWTKLIPFAGWVWATNILFNMYHVADRYMLIHFASIEATDAAGLVGQYHSSRVVPDLMLAAASLLGGILLPYMSNAWESADKQSVWQQLTLTLKVVSLGFTSAAAAFLLVAPFLFEMVLGGKYHDGLAVLPLTFLYCIWTGLLTLASTYLWCRERPGVGSAALLVGVIINLLMNLLLVPSLGLQGAIIATAIANASALSLTYYFSARLDMPISRSLVLVSAVPLVLLTGTMLAPLLAVTLLAIAWKSSLLLSEAEKLLLHDGIRSLATRLPGSKPAT